MKLPDAMRQKAKTDRQAMDRWRLFVQRSLRCINQETHLQIAPPALPSSEELRVLFPSVNPIPLTTRGGPPLFLDFRQSAIAIPHPDYNGEWKMSTRSYRYGILPAKQADALIAWDWHPGGSEGTTHPHIHVSVDDHLGKGPRLHIPTGERVPIEQIIRFLIQDFNVEAIPNWAEVLDDTQARFARFKTRGR